MITLEDSRPLAAANLLLVAIVFFVLGVALIVSVSRKKTWRLPLARAQFDSPAIKPNVSKAPMPIRIAFIWLEFTLLGFLLFAVFADHLHILMPDWLDRVWDQIFSPMLTTLFVTSCLLIRRDPELARCGFAVAIFALLLPLLAPA